MIDGRIIQIIPAPADLRVRYKMDDGEMEQCRLLCLALVEHDNGDTCIELVDIDKDGYIDFADEACNFDGVDWVSRRKLSPLAASKSPAPGNLQEKAPASAANADEGTENRK